ncbi:cytochrome P450 [Streptosporangium lutulentum]|uniref:cytochrome P450 n=1 Tax=Streptosporangium lutulentum TaxID=1461250 RepID=UPI0027D89AC0|nr:cytochrome P450 [Streptosporangium lutulentum]
MTTLDLLGFDPFAPDFLRAPYRRYRELREQGPLFRTPAGMWLATGYAPCAALLRDPRFGHGEGPPGRVRGTRSFLVMDPPDHTRLRALVSRAFTARMIERLRPRVSAIAEELVGKMSGEVDVISALAYPLPVRVISEMLGVPAEDQARFQGWSESLARGLDPDFLLPEKMLAERDAARAEFHAYFAELLVRRRAEPGQDLLSALVTADELTTEELLSTCVLLLVAGHETTVNLIGNGTLALLRHGALRRFRGGDERDTAKAVEELLRYDPPVQLTLRFALEDVELCGTPIRRGEAVMALLGAANRDPEVFADPERLDLDRGPARHLAFGLGVHFCLGAPLARMEGAVALSALATAAPDLTLADPAPPYKENLTLRGLAALPVRFSPSA